MSVSDITLSAVVANHAQAAQAMTNAAIKQQHTAEQAIVRMLDEAVAQPPSSSAGGGVDIIV
jgi:hypothetical protein